MISKDINNTSVCQDASSADLIDFSSAIMVRFPWTREAFPLVASC